MASNPLNIAISAFIEQKSKEQILQDINKFQEQVNKNPLKFKIDIDSQEFKQFSANVEKLGASMNKALNVKSNSDGLITYTEKLKQVTGQQEKLVETVTKYKNTLNQTISEVDRYDKEGKKVIETTTTITDATKKENAELEKQISLFQKKMSLESQRVTGKYGSLVDSDSLNALNKDIKNLSTSTPDVNNKMKQFSLGMKEVELNAKNSSKAIKNTKQDSIAFFEDLSRSAFKFTEWYLLAGAVTGIIGLFKDMPKIVSEIDKSLTEINKVLDLSKERMNSLSKEATQLGIAYGKTTIEVLGAIGAFAKAGMDEETSKIFSKLALLLGNVGDMSIEASQEMLIAANAGYQLGNDYSKLNLLISEFNELNFMAHYTVMCM